MPCPASPFLAISPCGPCSGGESNPTCDHPSCHPRPALPFPTPPRPAIPGHAFPRRSTSAFAPPLGGESNPTYDHRENHPSRALPRRAQPCHSAPCPGRSHHERFRAAPGSGIEPDLQPFGLPSRAVPCRSLPNRSSPRQAGPSCATSQPAVPEALSGRAHVRSRTAPKTIRAMSYAACLRAR